MSRCAFDILFLCVDDLTGHLPEGVVRIVIPDLNKNQFLRKIYSKRLEVSEDDLVNRVEEAKREFGGLGKIGHVEIYSTTKYLNHACYLFDSGGVLALYSYKSGRTPTPAFSLWEGELLRFLREDFEWLVSPSNPTRQVIQFPSS